MAVKAQLTGRGKQPLKHRLIENCRSNSTIINGDKIISQIPLAQRSGSYNLMDRDRPPSDKASYIASPESMRGIICI